MFGAAQAAEEAGDLDGFLARVEVRAFRMAQVALGHREDALDAVQDAMERMLGYRHRPPEEWPPLFWSVLRRRLTDHHRRATVQRRLLGWLVGSDGGEDGAEDPLDALPDPGADPTRALDHERALRRLSCALRDLPARQREAFLLRVLQGLDLADTARAMGCGEGSVKTHLSRALGALRERLEDWR